MNQLRERSIDALRYHPLYRPAHLAWTVVLTAGIPFYVGYRRLFNHRRNQ